MKQLDCCLLLTSVIKDVKEALVQLFLPELTLGRDTDNHQALIRTRVHVDELALLWLEVGLSRAFRILSRLIQLISDGHVHLHLDARQVDMVVLVPHHEILVAIVPEKWMRLHLH